MHIIYHTNNTMVLAPPKTAKNIKRIYYGLNPFFNLTNSKSARVVQQSNCVLVAFFHSLK